MIISKLQGGLGNQLFQYVGALVAAKGNKSNIYVDGRYYWYVRNRSYVLDRLGIQVKKLSVGEWFSLVSGKYESYSEKTPYDFDERLAKLDRPVYLSGFWQHRSYVDLVAKELISTIHFPRLTGHELTLSAQIGDTESVAMHVRRGDYLRSNSFAVCLPSYYSHAIEDLRRQTKKPHFFFFSDDLAWCRQEFGDQIDFTYVDGTFDELSDLQLMSLCKHHVIANSTFSWWGARLKQQHGIVIAPKDWCGNKPAARALILPTWKTIVAS